MKALLCMSVVAIMLFLNCGGEENNAPVINSVTADPASVYPSEDVTLTCDAEDEDGDTIIYHWSAEAGMLSASDSAVVTWTAPNDSGHFVMEVIVEDEEGLADTGDVIVTVNPNWAFGQNLTQYGISVGQITHSFIEIVGAPIGATIDSLSMTVSVTHLAPQELSMRLTSPDNTHLVIWPYGSYPGGTQSFATDHFAGEEVNGSWHLEINGGYGTATGTLDWWEITIYWGL
jgi:subtilisin-like proprotein convertase family protein